MPVLCFCLNGSSPSAGSPPSPGVYGAQSHHCLGWVSRAGSCSLPSPFVRCQQRSSPRRGLQALFWGSCSVPPVVLVNTLRWSRSEPTQHSRGCEEGLCCGTDVCWGSQTPACDLGVFWCGRDCTVGATGGTGSASEGWVRARGLRCRRGRSACRHSWWPRVLQELPGGEGQRQGWDRPHNARSRVCLQCCRGVSAGGWEPT